MSLGDVTPTGARRVADTRFHVSGMGPSEPPEVLALLLEDGEGPESLPQRPGDRPWEAALPGLPPREPRSPGLS